MRRVRFVIDGTGRRMTCTVEKVRMPWEGAWTRMRWLARHLRRYLRAYYRWRWGAERVWDFDPETLDMRDPKMERRRRRREWRGRIFAKVANALTAMVEMQKHIK